MPKRTVDKEQFFTAPALAKGCTEAVDRQFDLRTFSVIIEPSAGHGAFVDLLPKERLISIDVDPKTPETVKADFLIWPPPAEGGRVLVIGNPPFGQRAALAVRFLEKACEFADVVAFILPRSFNKYTFQNRVNPNFHLVHSLNCEEMFTIGNEEKPVKTVFQIWERRSALREKIQYRKTHPHFKMKHAHLSRTSREQFELLCHEHDFAIAQVGTNFSPKDCEDLSQGSYWFIKGLAAGVRERFELLDFSFLDDMNTAHKSLGKADIVAAYEAATPPDLKAENGPEVISSDGTLF